MKGKSTMKLFRYMLLVCAISIVTGCSSDAKNALINDVAIPVNEDSGYEVIAVNGKPPNRVRNDYITMVPFVVLEPGPNMIEVKQKHGSAIGKSAMPKTSTFNVVVSKNKKYRIHFENGVFSLVDEKT